MSCPHCDDTGWKTVVLEGVRRVTRCDCWRNRLAQRLLGQAGIPRRYQSCTFDSFITYPNERLLNAVARARRFAEEFPVVDRGLMMIGPPGIGKTHLAVAVLRHVVATKGARGLYHDTRTLLSQIRSTYNPDTRTAEMDLIGPAKEADLLVLDDLGAERLTDWVEETMNLIVTHRYNERRPTIFTSNYEDTPDTADPATLYVRVGFRMHSRLREMCHFLEFDGPDYRDLPPNPGPEDLLTYWKAHPRRLPSPPTRPLQARPRRDANPNAGLKWPGGRAGT